MPIASAPVLDALRGLLDAERNSIFRLTGADSPYLQDAGPDLRRMLQEMSEVSYQHERELADAIRKLGGDTAARAGERSEPPYLEFLSLKFLLPKLANAKALMIRYYENALRAIGPGGAEVETVLQRHLARHRADLDALNRATVELGH